MRYCVCYTYKEILLRITPHYNNIKVQLENNLQERREKNVLHDHEKAEEKGAAPPSLGLALCLVLQRRERVST